MTSACAQGEGRGCRKQRSCCSVVSLCLNNRGTRGMYRQFLIKKTPLSLLRKFQETKKDLKKPAKQVPHCVPQVYVTARRATHADVPGACQGVDALGSESASLAWPLRPSDSIQKCWGEGNRVTGTKHPQRSTWPPGQLFGQEILLH